MEYTNFRKIVTGGLSGLALVASTAAYAANAEMIEWVVYKGQGIQCFTESKKYSSNHPCHSVVQKYWDKQKQATLPVASSPATSYKPIDRPSSSERLSYVDRSFDRSVGSTSSGGHKVCHKK